MSKNFIQKPLATALGAAFLSVAATSVVQANENPFSANQLSSGYMQIAGMEGKCGGSKAKEGKCGGAKMEEATEKAKEGKCGEGKCGGAKKMEKAKEGKCGGAKKMEKAKEGKCGEGKCGGNK